MGASECPIIPRLVNDPGHYETACDHPLAGQSAAALDAAAVVRVARALQRKQRPGLALSAARWGEALERTPVPPAEVHSHDGELLCASEILALTHVFRRDWDDHARVTLPCHRRARRSASVGHAVSDGVKGTTTTP